MKVTNCSGTLKGVIETKETRIDIGCSPLAKGLINIATDDISIWAEEMEVGRVTMIRPELGDCYSSIIYHKCIELED